MKNEQWRVSIVELPPVKPRSFRWHEANRFNPQIISRVIQKLRWWWYKNDVIIFK